MILPPAEYRLIAPTYPFTRPPNPGVLIPNPSRTAAQIASAEDTHRLTKQIYLETLLLERTFIQKIIETIDTKYLAALCNPITGKITPLLPTIPEFLHDNCGRITLQQLDDKTTTVTKSKREFSTNHLGRRQSWLTRHDPPTRRVSPHRAYLSIHSAT